MGLQFTCCPWIYPLRNGFKRAKRKDSLEIMWLGYTHLTYLKAKTRNKDHLISTTYVWFCLYNPPCSRSSNFWNNFARRDVSRLDVTVTTPGWLEFIDGYLVDGYFQIYRFPLKTNSKLASSSLKRFWVTNADLGILARPPFGGPALTHEVGGWFGYTWISFRRFVRMPGGKWFHPILNCVLYVLTMENNGWLVTVTTHSFCCNDSLHPLPWCKLWLEKPLYNIVSKKCWL